MRYFFLTAFLLASLPVSAHSAGNTRAAAEAQGSLIKSIVIEGFVLGDKGQFVRMFKPYRNKYLMTADMDEILGKIQHIYEEEGYGQLVSVTYQVKKHRLVYTVLMTS